VAKKGFRYNNVGKKQKYQCCKCKTWFVEPDGFERMRYKPETIIRAIHMHEEGMSLSKVQNHLWQHDGERVTRSTISNWTAKYSVFLKSAKSKSKTYY
ncbi:MAG: hypothetical protein U9Q69_01675, partial [Nanoarchaeota archaeon]|nr:hypothetical protein [Nanoarchaeota archaeon]